MKCAVLGGRGFIGTHLISALLAINDEVRCFDRPNVQAIDTDSGWDFSNVEFIDGDFMAESWLENVLQGVDVCFHLISTTIPKTSNESPVFDVQSNVVGTIRLLDACLEAGVKKVVFVSSGGTVYGIPECVPISELHPTNPICSYGITKLAVEKYLSLYKKLYGLEYMVFRLSNPYGIFQRVEATQGVVAVFLNRIINGYPLKIWGDGSIVRDYVNVKDVVSALLLARDKVVGQRLFNIGSGSGASLNEIIELMELTVGKKAIKHYTKSRDFDVPVNILDIRLAHDLLGWKPAINLVDGVRELAYFYMSTPIVPQ
jgi:UDP-glucose 4-epimerase